jgi:hypothetical protein
VLRWLGFDPVDPEAVALSSDPVGILVERSPSLVERRYFGIVDYTSGTVLFSLSWQLQNGPESTPPPVVVTEGVPAGKGALDCEPGSVVDSGLCSITASVDGGVPSNAITADVYYSPS